VPQRVRFNASHRARHPDRGPAARPATRPRHRYDPPRANTPGAFVRSTSRGFIRYGNGLRALDEAGLPPQHIPAPVERATTGELVPTAASDDAKEVTP